MSRPSLAAHADPRRRPPRPPRKPPFVGRSAELRQVMRLLAAAEHGEPQMAVIEGPAGIGKTRLAEEVAERAQRRGGRVALGRCWQDGEAPPLWPWRAILRDLGAAEGLLDESPAPGHARFARFLAVLDHLRGSAEAAPFVIVLDDAHLADPPSLMLARFLARERGLGLLLLLTCRDERPEAAPETRELLSELGRDAVVVPLSGLAPDAVGAYLAAREALPADAELLHAITAVTRGNPLHLRSLTIHRDLGAGGVRRGLERSIRDVLGELTEADRRLIAVAALLGPDVSVHEVARVAEAAPAVAAESLTHAVDKGLAGEPGSGRVRFVHELVRRAATASLPVADRLDMHARAAAMLTGHEPEQISRRAHHALAAAARSKADAERAVEIAREAARALKAADGFEAAAALLGRAAEIHAAAALTGPVAALVVEQAEAVLACGRPAESRPLFQRASRLAEGEGDVAAFARAALGLGGVWLGEHRLANDAERMAALQRQALDALPADEAVLRARLSVRLAAEEVYRGGPVAPVLAGVEAARATGDAHALAESLSLAHHVLLTPEQTWRRPAVVAELLAAAAAAGDGLLSLMGLCWQAADLFLLGDHGAAAALEKLRLRADALRCHGILFIVRAMQVMLAIRAGEFERAEKEAAACFALGTEAGDPDALSYHGAHLSAIRYFQGREAELADLAASIAGSATLIEERERAFASAAALFALRAGRPQAGRALLERFARDGVAAVPPSSSWLVAMLGVVELAFELQDERSAQAAYNALLPYAELPVMASLGVVCFGSVHRCLGLAARTCGKLDLAVEHFAAAVAANEQLGHRPAAIQAQAELALARLQRASDAGDPRGRALLQDAVAAGTAAGMAGAVARWQHEGAGTAAAAPRHEPSAALITLVQAGRWRVVLEGQVATVPDRVGMRYLAQLVAAPGRGIPALALVVQGSTQGMDHGSADPVLDRKALLAVRERARELRERATLDPGEREELTALTRELARATGLGGRTRSFADAPERARTAVKKAIKRAIEEIALANPSVGRHLEERVQTGAVCCYELRGA